jgi:hypothetical protein
MIFFGLGTSSLIVSVFLAVWLRWNRCLGLVGSALVGALFVSSLMDFLWAWGGDEAWASRAVPLLMLVVAGAIMRVENFLPTPRWIAFGVVAMFVIRAVVMAPTHREWSGRLSGNVREWLILSGLDPSALATREEIPPVVLAQVEMPCGLGNFLVHTDDLKSMPGAFRLRIEPCGFSPSAFRARGSETLEVSNALTMAVQVSFAPQGEDGDYFSTWSIVVPPESSVEVPDFKVPVGGTVLIYAPLEPRLGAVFGSNVQVPGEFRVSREPLLLKRQVPDAH